MTSWVVLRKVDQVFVLGVDSGGSAHVELQSRWKSTFDEYRYRAELRYRGERSDIVISILKDTADSATLEISNELGRASGALRRAYELLETDLEQHSASEEISLSSGNRWLAGGLRFQDVQLVEGCPSSLTCRDTVLACAKSPVLVALNCHPGKTILKAGFKVGKKLIKSILSDDPEDDFDPIGDCVDSVKSIGECDQIDEECIDIYDCQSSVEDACARECSVLLNGPCNYVGDDGVPGTSDDAPSCDEQVKSAEDCKKKCLTE